MIEDVCGHVKEINNITPRTDGCEECTASGEKWIHLRICMTCGHVGCCDLSRNRHATKHFHETGHPVIKSFEPGEGWGWCYMDDLMFKSIPYRTPPDWE
jgi:uncharacterized UBP type Zn finger protein